MLDGALVHGGRCGGISEHGLQSTIARPYSGYHRAISKMCAALLHLLIKNHPFADGNKRTAWMLTEALIERSGWILDEDSEEEIEEVVVGVANGDYEFEEIVVWFRVGLSKPG